MSQRFSTHLSTISMSEGDRLRILKSAPYEKGVDTCPSKSGVALRVGGRCSVFCSDGITRKGVIRKIREEYNPKENYDPQWTLTIKLDEGGTTTTNRKHVEAM